MTVPVTFGARWAFNRFSVIYGVGAAIGAAILFVAVTLPTVPAIGWFGALLLISGAWLFVQEFVRRVVINSRGQVRVPGAALFGLFGSMEDNTFTTRPRYSRPRFCFTLENVRCAMRVAPSNVPSLTPEDTYADTPNQTVRIDFRTPLTLSFRFTGANTTYTLKTIYVSVNDPDALIRDLTRDTT